MDFMVGAVLGQHRLFGAGAAPTINTLVQTRASGNRRLFEKIRS